jgi:hypothetical protein
MPDSFKKIISKIDEEGLENYEYTAYLEDNTNLTGFMLHHIQILFRHCNIATPPKII